MGRSVIEASIATRNARSKLPAGKAVHWRAIDRGLHLGYRKGRDGGTWVVRRRKPDRAYETHAIGSADDVLEPDGRTCLSHSQALQKARAWCEKRAQAEVACGQGTEAPLTVADAMADYLAYLDAEKKTARDARYRVNAHILPALGQIEIAKLTTPKLRSWHGSLATTPPRIRSARGQPAKFRVLADNPDAKRQRKAAANRVLTILKAALNRAFEHDKRVPNDEAWRRVKPFKNVDAPRIDYLTMDECRRLVNASPADFRQLVRAALYTGCRYAEIATMLARDFNPDVRTVFVRPSKSGKGRHVVLTDEAASFFAAAAASCSPEDRIFRRADDGPWLKSHQARRLAEAARAARIGRPITFHVLRHTHASHLAMRGTPMAVIAAQLGHSDTRMVTKHYAHLSPSYVADTIRANLPPLDMLEDETLVPLTRAAK